MHVKKHRSLIDKVAVHVTVTEYKEYQYVCNTCFSWTYSNKLVETYKCIHCSAESDDLFIHYLK
mgnify:CR=1 FL=1